MTEPDGPLGGGDGSDPRTIPVETRLWSRVTVKPGCWEWTGAVTHNGYGQIGLGGAGGKRVRVHRLAYELRNGPIQAGLEIDHLCRNRRCCNPAHMEAVTREENIRRGNAPNAINARKTHCNRGHALSGENLRMLTRGRRIMRSCRTCERINNRAQKLKTSRIDHHA